MLSMVSAVRTTPCLWYPTPPPPANFRAKLERVYRCDTCLPSWQAGIRRGILEDLVAETRTYDVEVFAEKRVITLGGRQKKYQRVAYNRGVLPFLPTRHPLSRLYLEEAHRIDHVGVTAMVMRS